MPEQKYGKLFVCGVAGVTEILSTAPRPMAVLSITSPIPVVEVPSFDGDPLIAHSVLRFEDCANQRRNAPTTDHVRQAIEYVQRQGDHPVLIHCECGISRSTAIALTILTSRLGPGQEQQAVQALYAITETAAPNLRLVHLAERALGLKTRALINALFAHPQISANIRGVHRDKFPRRGLTQAQRTSLTAPPLPHASLVARTDAQRLL